VNFIFPDVERALNGILIKEGQLNDITADVLDGLSIDNFAIQNERFVFSHILELSKQGKTFDLINLDAYLSTKAKQDYEIAGGFAGLAERVDLNPSNANALAYKEKLLESHLTRNLLSSLNTASEIIHQQGDLTENRNLAISELSKLDTDSHEGKLESLSKSLDDFLDDVESRFNNEGSNGLKTGFNYMDSKIGGLEDGNLIIVAGKPGSGKTTFALNIARNNFLDKNDVLMFSAEMTKRELNMKLCSDVGRVNLNSLKNGSALGDDYGYQGIANYMAKMKESPFYVDDQGGIHINQIITRAKKHKIRYGKPKLIIVDYIQIIKADAQSRYLEVSAVSMALKALAKEMECPVIALSQMKKNTNGRPVKADLRESGQIEQDADMIFFMHTDNDDNIPMQGQFTECINAKSRMGEGAIYLMENQLHQQRFVCAGDKEPEEKQEQSFF